jgi:hypothetical protein
MMAFQNVYFIHSSITVYRATTIRIYLDIWLFKYFKSLQAEIVSATVGNESSQQGHSLSLAALMPWYHTWPTKNIKQASD